MSKTQLGFDLGSSSLKAAFVHNGDVYVETFPLPEQLADGRAASLAYDLAKFLSQVRKKLSLPWRTAVLTLPPSEAACFPPAPQDHSTLQGAVFGQTADLQRQRLSYMRAFACGGIWLKAVLSQEAALLRLIRAQKKPPRAALFIDLGHRSTRMMAVEQGVIQASWQIAAGGHDLDLVIADELGVSSPRANLCKSTNFHGVLFSPAFACACERIAIELLKILACYRSAHPSGNPAGVYLVGGGAAVPPLRQSIANILGLKLLPPASLLPGAGDQAAAGVFAAGGVMG